MCNLLSHLSSFPLTILDAKELSITTIQVFLLLCAFSRRKNAVGFVLHNCPLVKVQQSRTRVSFSMV